MKRTCVNIFYWCEIGYHISIILPLPFKAFLGPCYCGSDLAVQREAVEHRDHARILGSELAEAQRHLSVELEVEHAGRRTLASSLVIDSDQFPANFGATSIFGF